VEDSSEPGPQDLDVRPGVAVVHSVSAPVLRVAALERRRLAIGRDDPIGETLADERLSRHHAEVSLNGDHWNVHDLGSRNGTFVDGVPVDGSARARPGAVVRAGGTVMLLVHDVRPLLAARIVEEGGIVRGPRTAAAFEAAARAAALGGPLLITGESGTGKELVARAFHAACSRPLGPFVPVNCATIPHGLAERVLFGAKRGAYSGATGDTEGHVQAAEGGVLFLDEIGELDAGVQAKLLRLLETKEVTALGSPTPRRANVRFCCATNRNLRTEAGEGRFRSDLYYRLNGLEVTLAPLRERREEIPWLVANAARQSGLDALHARLVEACMLLPWPGNVRELVRETRHAADRARDGVLRAEHLRAEAGCALGPSLRARTPAPTPEAIEEALAREGGNVAAAARSLGLHRTQLRRFMQTLGLPRTCGPRE
jgi:DNA-binding NtrC family response regulator